MRGMVRPYDFRWTKSRYESWRRDVYKSGHTQGDIQRGAPSASLRDAHSTFDSLGDISPTRASSTGPPGASPSRKDPTRSGGFWLEKLEGKVAAGHMPCEGDKYFSLRLMCGIHDFMMRANMRVSDLFRCPAVNASYADEGDDELDVDELTNVLKGVDPQISREMIVRGVAQIDRDAKGAINVEELTSALRWARRLMRNNDLMHDLACVVNQERCSSRQGVKPAMLPETTGSVQNKQLFRSTEPTDSFSPSTRARLEVFRASRGIAPPESILKVRKLVARLPRVCASDARTLRCSCQRTGSTSM